MINDTVEDDDGDFIRCRWAESSLGECGGVCQTFPANLNETAVRHNCTICVARSYIILTILYHFKLIQCALQYQATGLIGRYAVAIQIEDFASPTDTLPMSSVPLQFLVLVYSSSESCTSSNATMPARSCMPFNTSWQETITVHSATNSSRLVDELSIFLHSFNLSAAVNKNC